MTGMTGMTGYLSWGDSGVHQGGWAENVWRFAGVRAEYDPVADALYLYVRPDDPPVAQTRQVSEQINVDLASDGTLIGYEIIGVSTLPQPGSAEDVP